MSYLYKECYKCNKTFSYSQNECSICKNGNLSVKKPDDIDVVAKSVFLTILGIALFGAIMICFLTKAKWYHGIWISIFLLLILGSTIGESIEKKIYLKSLKKKMEPDINCTTHNFISGFEEKNTSYVFNDVAGGHGGRTITTTTTWIIYCDKCGKIIEKQSSSEEEFSL